MLARAGLDAAADGIEQTLLLGFRSRRFLPQPLWRKPFALVHDGENLAAEAAHQRRLQARNRRQLPGVFGLRTRDVHERRVRHHPTAWKIFLLCHAFAPRGQLRQHRLLRRRERFPLFEPLPGELGIVAVEFHVRLRGALFHQPRAPPERDELLFQMPVHLAQIAHIVRGVRQQLRR